MKTNSMSLSDAIVEAMKAEFAKHPGLRFTLYREARKTTGYINGKTLKFFNVGTKSLEAYQGNLRKLLKQCVVVVLKQFPNVCAWMTNRHGVKDYSVSFTLPGTAPTASPRYFEVERINVPTARTTKGSRTPTTSKENKKYEFVATDSIPLKPVGQPRVWLYRIRALADIPGVVKAGELGGYIQSELNLHFKDRAWVGDNAKVCGSARVAFNAHVYENAKAIGSSKDPDIMLCIYDSARVCGDAIIKGAAQIYGRAIVTGVASVSDEACVSGHAYINQCAQIYDTATVQGYARVSGAAKVGGDVLLTGDCFITGDALIDGDVAIMQGYMFMDTGHIRRDYSSETPDPASWRENATVGGGVLIGGEDDEGKPYTPHLDARERRKRDV